MKTLTQINASIKAIGNANGKLRDMVQTTLIDINAHAVQHGEASLYGKLLDATKGQNRVAINQWIAKYGAGRYDKTDGIWKVNATWLKDHRNGAKTKDECLAARAEYETSTAELPKWYDLDNGEAKRVQDVWDALDAVQNMIAKCDKVSAKGQGQNLDMARFLRVAVASFKNEHNLVA